ncbi:MAG TPA: dockerin type I domain-containing protein, partial [Candidatus Saccharimonadia bacterium]
PWSPPVGLNYLKACGTPSPNDEFDYWEPDVNDDNVVNQADVTIAQSYVGQGDGRNYLYINDYVNANPQPETGPWRRYDMDMDGWVKDLDVNIVRSHLGKLCSN